MKSQDTKPESVIIATPLTEVTSINQTLNKVLGATSVVVVIFIVIAAMHGESINKIIIEIDDDSYVRVDVWERGNESYITNENYSYVMEFGEYEVLETSNEWNSTHVFVEYELPVEEGGAAPNGIISLAYWLPKVEPGVKVPVIAEFGPYFQEP
ncbi:MAG: hypothetical protein VX613_02005, partial [Candidatus Thermoplasmatota archaeon]|nr:hypothetical protein [Candidatus Thermoplasmatota archaeon]